MVTFNGADSEVGTLVGSAAFSAATEMTPQPFWEPLSQVGGVRTLLQALQLESVQLKTDGLLPLQVTTP
jgi:hypothetical protein